VRQTQSKWGDAPLRLSCDVAIMFSNYLARWDLTPDGKPIITPTSKLLPVRAGLWPGMLKIAVIEEEKVGNKLMTWWNGHGAARVLAHSEDAILMERAEHGPSLADVARDGKDDEASRIICSVVAKLHEARPRPPCALLPLTEWFEALRRAAQSEGGILHTAVTTASKLLAGQHDALVLHGDMHHDNVLNFGSRGWLAIDPKGLIGERYFDYANIFCNPDDKTATTPGRLPRQIRVVADAAGLERNRLLEWVLAWAGLSAAFLLEDGRPPHSALRVAEIAAAELGAS
jgi:streptomycin 6-kinase